MSSAHRVEWNYSSNWAKVLSTVISPKANNKHILPQLLLLPDADNMCDTFRVLLP